MRNTSCVWDFCLVCTFPHCIISEWLVFVLCQLLNGHGGTFGPLVLLLSLVEFWMRGGHSQQGGPYTVCMSPHSWRALRLPSGQAFQFQSKVTGLQPVYRNVFLTAVWMLKGRAQQHVGIRSFTTQLEKAKCTYQEMPWGLSRILKLMESSGVPSFFSN